MKKNALVKQRNLPFYVDEKAFVAFVDRVTQGKYGKRVHFQRKESESGFDEYNLSVRSGEIFIQATSGCAGGAALNAYLKKYCRYQYGILGVSGDIPDMPPDTETDITETSVFHYRYAFNYCTFGYSYAFNTWEDWEKITDYLILAGYNLVLNPIGNECVWLELLQEFGYTKEDAKKHIAAPNYLPWQWMMNLSEYRSNYPDYWFEEQKEISQKFNAKLKAFGMSAVMPGYCGAVPDDFATRYPNEKIAMQGKWANFTRPAILLPPSEMFTKLCQTYYRLQKQLLGSENMHYYSVDPFHEGGEKDGVRLSEFTVQTYAEMQKADEKAVWAIQGWLENPDREMLASLNKESVLIMNLLGDNSPDGGDGFLGYPHIYCVVNNFGGEQAMRGSAGRTYLTAHAMAKKGECVGIGVMPEGVECDELLFDIIAEVSVKSDLKPVREYLREYITARYGVCNDKLIEAYEILWQKVYVKDSSKYEHESGLIARPSPTVNRVCYWALPAVVEDFSYLRTLLSKLLENYEICKNKDAYITDVTSVARQLVGNISWRYIYALNEAFAKGDKQGFYENKKALESLFPLQEAIIDHDKNLSLEVYLQKAEKRGKTQADREWFVRCAKQLITLWGERGCFTLFDYAAREYGDMVRLVYKPRWEKYLQYAQECLESGSAYEEKKWCEIDEKFLQEKYVPCKVEKKPLKEAIAKLLEYV